MQRTCVCSETPGQRTGFGSGQRCKHPGCVNKFTNSSRKKKESESISADYDPFSCYSSNKDIIYVFFSLPGLRFLPQTQPQNYFMSHNSGI